MNVEDITFGVEIETIIPQGRIQVGPHGHGLDIPEIEGWKADRDPSIRRQRGFEACEFVSPVLKGSNGLVKLLEDLKKIKAIGAKVNVSCGLHIHVGVNKEDSELMTRLITLVSNFEKAIYASTGTKRREQGRWCNGLNRYGSVENVNQRARHDRYHVANIATGSKPTVEFSAFAGTLDAIKLAGYVRLCVGLVERALRAKKTTEWTAKKPVETSPINRGGEGQTAITRLFYQLGWTKGRQPHVHGELKGPGVPELLRIKKEFMRLAKKYDTPATPVVRANPYVVGAQIRVNYLGANIHDQTGTIVGACRRGLIVEVNGTRFAIARHRVRIITQQGETSAQS